MSKAAPRSSIEHIGAQLTLVRQRQLPSIVFSILSNPRTYNTGNLRQKGDSLVNQKEIKIMTSPTL